jgi:putative ABC transport system permease protein
MRGDDEIDKELRFHIDTRIDDLVASGMAPDEARRHARLEFGGAVQVKEALHDQDSWRFLDNLLRDVRYAARSLRRAPAFAVTAALVLGLGIGVNATVFTIVNTLLLRPLPFPGAHEIVQVKRRVPMGSSGSFSMHDYLALTSQRTALSKLAILDVFCDGRYTLMIAGAAEPVRGCRVSADFFGALDAPAVRGRLLTQGDDIPGATPAVVLAHAFWRQRFGSDPWIVGRSVTIGGQPHIVVGVAPQAVQAFSHADMFLSLAVPPASSDRTNSFQVIGRIAPGVSREQAETQIDAIARRSAQTEPSLTNMPQGIVLHALQDDFVAPIRPALRALTVAVGLVLLIACSNVANLVLARALVHRRDVAMMAALGASRARIVQRVLAENLLIALVGGGAGLLLAYAGVRALPALSAAGMPQADRIQIDAHVYLYVMGTAALAGVLAGLPHTLQLAGGDLVRGMKTGSAQGGASGSRLRLTLTVSQIALSTMLLAGAGLLTRSFWNLASTDPGFRADGVLTMTVSLTPSRYPDSARVAAYADEVVHRLERIPGVRAASSTTALPTEFPIDFPVSVAGGADQRTLAGRPAELDAWYRAINPHFFTAMEIPLLEGRALNDGDTAESAPVIVINQSLAHLAFPTGPALGRALVVGNGYLKDARDLRPRTVVGIVGDTRERGLRFAPTLTMYVPVAQSPEPITRLVVDKIPLRWVARTSGESPELLQAVRRAVLAVDPAQPPADFATLSDVLSRSIAPQRFNMLMLALFSGISTLLAAVGVYGLTAYAVVQRTRELGIRLSLGAPPAAVVRELLLQGLRLGVGGTILGLLGATALGYLLRSLLFGVSAVDGPTIISVFTVMTTVVVIATYLPAARASSIDPIGALREDVA